MKQIIGVIIVFIVGGAAWNHFVYGIHRNSYYEDIKITAPSGELFEHYQTMAPGTVKLIFKENTIEVSVPGGELIEINKYPSGSRIDVTEYKQGLEKPQGATHWVLL